MQPPFSAGFRRRLGVTGFLLAVVLAGPGLAADPAKPLPAPPLPAVPAVKPGTDPAPPPVSPPAVAAKPDAAAAAPAAPATAPPAAVAPSASGLPIPRFVSLRSAEVNVRTGPGTKYPLDWVFIRRDMPVEITAEVDTWRRIRAYDGTEGWVHQSMLTGRRAMVVTGATRTLRSAADAKAGAVALVEAGAMGRLLACTGAVVRGRDRRLSRLARPHRFLGGLSDRDGGIRASPVAAPGRTGTSGGPSRAWATHD